LASQLLFPNFLLPLIPEEKTFAENWKQALYRLDAFLSINQQHQSTEGNSEH